MTISSLRIVFAGTPEFALPCLEGIYRSEHQLKAVYTQPDRPAGRGQKLQYSPVKEWALEHHLPIYQPLNFKEEAAISLLAKLEADLLVVIAYGLILPSQVLAIPRLGCINVHASLLPRWRGASPIQHAILYNDIESGVTIMQMDRGMDTGNRLCERQCVIESTETAGSLHNKLAQLAVEPLLASLSQLAQGQIKPEIQDDSQATYAGKIKKEDARIDWNKTAQEIDCQIRAFNPWPIAYTHANDSVLRIHQAKIAGIPCSDHPGTILRVDKLGLLIATGQSALLVEKIQLPGSKVIRVADWLNGNPNHLFAGLVLE